MGLRSLPFHFALFLLPAAFSGVSPFVHINQALANDDQQQPNLSVPTVARLVTVRILANSGAGSGVLIERQGQTYTVLTNAHVVAATENRYQILTADGKIHSGRWLRSVQFGTQDLALVQFSSDRAYQLAAIGNFEALSIGDPVYASGFPNWRLNSNTLQETRDWGLKAFQLTQGKVGMLPSIPLQQGYQLGYTNQIEPGMSGGPVFNKYGQLVGINGGLSYPDKGIIAFVFADGTMPSETMFQQMESLSWAIPIANLHY